MSPILSKLLWNSCPDRTYDGNYKCCPVFDQYDGRRLTCRHTLSLIYLHRCAQIRAQTRTGCTMGKSHWKEAIAVFSSCCIQSISHSVQNTQKQLHSPSCSAPVPDPHLFCLSSILLSSLFNSHLVSVFCSTSYCVPTNCSTPPPPSQLHFTWQLVLAGLSGCWLIRQNNNNNNKLVTVMRS